MTKFAARSLEDLSTNIADIENSTLLPGRNTPASAQAENSENKEYWVALRSATYLSTASAVFRSEFETRPFAMNMADEFRELKVELLTEASRPAECRNTGKTVFHPH